MSDFASNPPTRGFRAKSSRLIQAVMEGIVLAMVSLSPWAFGAVETGSEKWLHAGVAVLLVLWGLRVLLDGWVSWKKCPVVLCLAALVLLGLAQLVSMPREMLAALSPATVQIYDQFLPDQPEVLPFGEQSETAVPPPGTTLSVYPGATQAMIFQIFVVFLLFAIVRNNTASVAALRRLCLACLVNGALLSLLALAQFFSSPHNVVYWTFPSPGQVFGPFICRNHFPFYVNVCLGLGLGVLLSWPKLSLSTLLERPRALWTSLALTLMLSSVAVSLSRGGLLALVGAALVCLCVRLSRPPRAFRLGASMLIVGMALALVVWFGLEPIQARLGTLWEGTALDGRTDLWMRGLKIAGDFPVWGTGHGTFHVVEPLHRTSAIDAHLVYEFAHNDYLEALVEGGLIRLLISLLAIGLIFGFGYRACTRYRGQPRAAIALGALLGFTTLVLHSFGDFGLHIPAIAVLATVLGAQLCCIGGASPQAASPSAPVPDRYSLRLWGAAPVAGAFVALLLGLAVFGMGWKNDAVHRFREAAIRLSAETDPANRMRQIAYIEHAAGLNPQYARLQLEAGQAHMQAFEAATTKLARRAGVAQVTQTVLAAAVADVAAPVPGGPLSRWFTACMAQELQIQEEGDELARKHLVPALRHFVRARDQSPLLLQAHLRLAANNDRFEKADGRSAYLKRAKLLTPNDPEAWYLFGLQEIVDGEPSNAWKSWRRSLELSEEYLADILTLLAKSPDHDSALRDTLPDRPTVLLTAAFHLYPGSEQTSGRQPLLERALDLVEGGAGPTTASDFYLQGRVQSALGRLERAEQAYEAALAREPRNVDWRYELAQILHQRGRLLDARHELLTVLGQQPAHNRARQLLTIVARDIATRG